MCIRDSRCAIPKKEWVPGIPVPVQLTITNRSTFKIKSPRLHLLMTPAKTNKYNIVPSRRIGDEESYVGNDFPLDEQTNWNGTVKYTIPQPYANDKMQADANYELVIDIPVSSSWQLGSCKVVLPLSINVNYWNKS
eukprot:TRINITY_DN19064_c0_g1_i1.p1 TRINITY_DN19064_c0_g1~~TRINITY_DN19064_c0_g1_i1.p1  ORF type:complete len:136 (-),score=19.54 TRINITY_DN19064_c0_g1_i1:71-478(-)